jgi:hypothetical protein
VQSALKDDFLEINRSSIARKQVFRAWRVNARGEDKPNANDDARMAPSNPRAKAVSNCATASEALAELVPFKFAVNCVLFCTRTERVYQSLIMLQLASPVSLRYAIAIPIFSIPWPHAMQALRAKTGLQPMGSPWHYSKHVSLRGENSTSFALMNEWWGIEIVKPHGQQISHWRVMGLGYFNQLGLS